MPAMTSIDSADATTRDLAQALISLMQEIAQRDNVDAWQKNAMKKLQKHLSLGNKMSFTNVPSEFEKDICEMLKRDDIPYLAIPGKNGNTMICVRDTDQDALYDKTAACESTSVAFYRQAAVRDVLTLYASSVQDQNRVPTLSFSDEIKNIAKERLSQSGIVYAEGVNKDDEPALIITRGSLFNKAGNDLSNFELQMALVQTQEDGVLKEMHAGLGKLREMQSQFDSQIRGDFVAAVKEGKTAKICGKKEVATKTIGADGKSQITKKSVVSEYPKLETRSGEVFFYPKEDDVGQKLDIKGGSYDEIKALVQNFQYKIPDNTIVTPSVPIEKAPVRPQALARGDKQKQDMFKSFERALSEVSSKVSAQMCEDGRSNFTSSVSRYEEKKRRIAAVLQNPDSELYKYAYSIVSQDGKASDEIIKATFADVAKNFSDTNQNSKYEVRIGINKHKDLQKANRIHEIQREKDRLAALQKAAEAVKENDTEEIGFSQFKE